MQITITNRRQGRSPSRYRGKRISGTLFLSTRGRLYLAPPTSRTFPVVEVRKRLPALAAWSTDWPRWSTTPQAWVTKVQQRASLFWTALLKQLRAFLAEGDCLVWIYQSIVWIECFYKTLLGKLMLDFLQLCGQFNAGIIPWQLRSVYEVGIKDLDEIDILREIRGSLSSLCWFREFRLSKIGESRQKLRTSVAYSF